MAIEQQMEMFGAGDMGRLDDDGMTKDPVSGNEIPPGSMANEVRDDIEARLSDGEYVVPANVVRFFGVKFFEDLRNKAMKGLADMEANGRIGGEPVSTEMPMQDQMAQGQPPITEEEMQMLKTLMNEGGYVQGYQEGGATPETPPYASMAYNPNQYPIASTYGTVGGSYFNPNLNPNVQPVETTQPIPQTPVVPESGIQLVTFVNPATGAIRVLQYSNGEPVNMDLYNSAIAEGFYPEGSTALDNARQEAARGPEDDYSIYDGTKPYNKMTVGEMAWSLTRETYAAGNPKSFTAGVNNLLGKGLATGAVKAALGNAPSNAALIIKQAKERLAAGNFTNELEKEKLTLIANQDGIELGNVHKNMVDGTGIILNPGKGMDNRVPDYSKVPKPKPATVIPEVTSEDKPYVPPTRPTFKPVVKPVMRPDPNDPSKDGQPVDAGGLTEQKRNEQYKEQDRETSAKGVSERLERFEKGFGGLNKGGLIKKPTKKKKTKTKK